MKTAYCVGIDLGSTTTKAVILDQQLAVLGKGITNSRSNYDVACQIAWSEALIQTRFDLVARRLGRRDQRLADLERAFRLEQYLAQLGELERRLGEHSQTLRVGGGVRDALAAILPAMAAEAARLYGEGAQRKSDFFRDLAGSRYLALAEQQARESGAPFDQLVALFDKAILDVENSLGAIGDFGALARRALRAQAADAELEAAVAAAAAVVLEQVRSVGTGYGRQRLPFPDKRLRSEILCHGLGAHALFPATRTVLDIGGQDTKAIQVDERGIVTSFQMNDRCAAGCGRYLGYIADEMNLGVHELGPLAGQATRSVRINSTCTVFAGAELRERLSLGEQREDILAGLHRAIVLRALSLLARSGGVAEQFTFTGGVARNTAAVAALRQLVRENYGERTMNISPDSIYTGALGAALFAWRDAERGAEQEAVA
jgi:benzoyl-CoA reductase subunit A